MDMDIDMDMNTNNDTVNDIRTLVDLTNKLYEIVNELKERVVYVESRNSYISEYLDEIRSDLDKKVSHTKPSYNSFETFFLTMESEFYKEYLDIQFKKERQHMKTLTPRDKEQKVQDFTIRFLPFIDKEDIEDYVRLYMKSCLYDKKAVENIMREGKKCKYSYKAQNLNTFCFGKRREFYFTECYSKLYKNDIFTTESLGLTEEEQTKFKKIWNKVYNNMNGTESCFVKIFLDV